MRYHLQVRRQGQHEDSLDRHSAVIRQTGVIPIRKGSCHAPKPWKRATMHKMAELLHCPFPGPDLYTKFFVQFAQESKRQHRLP
ncbi:MAG TPA: hypothetical protein VGN75_11175 [Kaistia sp.]|jgi:hypothetical protein|nr:hypothetical protein [Kaistia sp.]